jgi:hypothetical protein
MGAKCVNEQESECQTASFVQTWLWRVRIGRVLCVCVCNSYYRAPRLRRAA